MPKESAAPCYLGLCETALHRKDYEEVKEFACKALEEPGIIPMNQITAWSYKCLARFNQGDSLGFEEALLRKDLGDARQTSETIHKAVEDFVGDAEPSDDLTKMCIKMR